MLLREPFFIILCGHLNSHRHIFVSYILSLCSPIFAFFNLSKRYKFQHRHPVFVSNKELKQKMQLNACLIYKVIISCFTLAGYKICAFVVIYVHTVHYLLLFIFLESLTVFKRVVVISRAYHKSLGSLDLPKLVGVGWIVQECNTTTQRLPLTNYWLFNVYTLKFTHKIFFRRTPGFKNYRLGNAVLN